MTEENISSVATKFDDCISKTQQAELKQRLQSVPDNKYETITAVKTKSTKMTTVLSAVFGLFGAGSFYLGLYKRGICKVVFNVVLPLMLGLIFLYWFVPLHREYSVQTKNIYSAVTENRQYEYSFDNLEYLHSDYEESYKIFSRSMSSISEECKKLVSVKDYLLEKSEEIKDSEKEYFLCIGKFTEFIQNPVINDLKTEIGNSLELLNEKEKEDNEDLLELTNEVNKIVAACNFLASSESITEYTELINGLIPKIDDLISAQSFDKVDSALNELEPLLKTVSQNNKFISSISKSKVEKLKNQLNVLNELAIKTQNDNNDVADNSVDTPLGLAIAEFERLYNELYETQIGKDISIDGYVEELVKNADSSTILASIINCVYESEEGNVTVSVNDMKLQKDKFVLNEAYFEYLSGDFVNSLKIANEQLPEANKNEVDNRISLSKTLSEICSSIENIKSETDISAVESGMDNVKNTISGLQNRLNKAYYHYWFNCMFVGIYFAIMLSIDGIIIAVYWIFDVFRNREKCQNANYNSIMRVFN